MAEAKLCAVEGCCKPSYVRGWCTTHYQRWQHHGDPLKGGWKRIATCQDPSCSKKVLARGLCSAHYKTGDFRPRCTVVGCEKPSHAGGICVMHDKRLKRNGSVHRRKRPANSELSAWIEDHKAYDGEECLIWPFWRDKFGYGRSRQMCEAAHGKPPTPEHQAAHSCGNGHLGCVNQRHLRWATRVDNQQEMVAHGNSNRGEKNPMTVLTELDVRKIRALSGTTTHRQIAALFNIDQSTVSRISCGKTWGWLQ